MCQIDHGENPCQFSRESEPRARVRLKCPECGHWIPPGDRYVLIVGRWKESGFGREFYCRWCSVRAKWLTEKCRGYMFGDIVQDFESHFATKAESLQVVFAGLGCLAEKAHES